MVRSKANDYECLYSFATKMRLQGSADKGTMDVLHKDFLVVSWHCLWLEFATYRTWAQR